MVRRTFHVTFRISRLKYVFVLKVSWCRSCWLISAISTDIICQTIVQHCRTSDLELTATCCVKLRLSLLSNADLTLICFLLITVLTRSASASVAA